jgi:superfamily II DNA or RNA helicase
MNMDFSKAGLYCLLNTPEVQRKLSDLQAANRAVFEKGDSETISRMVAKVVSDEVERFVSDKLDGMDEDARKNPSWIHDAVKELSKRGGLPEESIPLDDKVLKEIKISSDAKSTRRPTTELNECSLIVPDGRTPTLGNEIALELESANRADWLVSFIKLGAVRAFYPQLQAFCGKSNPDGSPRLRIATTTYMGATDAKALKLLFKLPNTQVKVCFNTSQTRLHAKAYIFRRESGFGTAYIGSANLSAPAMSSGMEWTVKVSQSEIPYLFGQSVQSFEGCWNNDSFELCNEQDLPRIAEALGRSRVKMQPAEKYAEDNILRSLILTPHPYQSKMLESLMAEREEGQSRHLVVSATGTGKTMVAAFDYAQMISRHNRYPNMLYIVHRTDILRGAAEKYRAVLKDDNFGCVLSDGDVLTASNGNQIFCTPQTWKTHFKDNGQYTADFFDMIVMDECHHTQANSYQELLDYYKPSIDSKKTDLLGITATPFRADGKDIRSDFGGVFTHELSLSEAIENGHIVPFNYFGIDDDTDFTGIHWKNGGATEREIESVLAENGHQLEHVYKTLTEYVQGVESLRGIGFCAGIKHAERARDFMNQKGVKSAVLTGASTQDERRKVIKDMTEFPPKVNLVFVADLFNEGVDIPCVNTVLMMRPTQSPLVFIQQLGRGLRIAPIQYDKRELLVLDFVGNHNKEFNGFSRYVQMSTRKDIPIEKQIEMGMPFLPAGCSITLTKITREKVLRNIKEYTAALRGQALKRHLVECIKNAGRELNLKELMERASLDAPAPIYKQSQPSILNSLALHDESFEKDFGESFNSLAQNDSRKMIQRWMCILNGQAQQMSEQEIRMSKFFLLSAFYPKVNIKTTDCAWDDFVAQRGMVKDMIEFLDWRLSSVKPLRTMQFPETGQFLDLHCTYNAKQISAAIGRSGGVIMKGTDYNSERNLDSFFITIRKPEAEFSPTTMYHDYAKSPSIFHWETPGRTTVSSSDGQRYVKNLSKKMLFIRHSKKVKLDVTGQHDITAATSYYTFLGPVKNVLQYEGEKPIGIDFEMKYALPADVYDYARGA